MVIGDESSSDDCSEKTPEIAYFSSLGSRSGCSCCNSAVCEAKSAQKHSPFHTDGE